MALSFEAIRISNLKSSKSLFRFKTLRQKDRKSFQLLEEYFYEHIQPIYGDQSRILEKIKAGQDRTCEFLICTGKPAGVLIYKNLLSNEFASFGIEDGLELKTIFLLEKKTKTSGLFLRSLLGRAAQMVFQKNGKCIFGTVSSKKPEVLKVMLKLGFNIIETFKGKYIENVDEYLICHRNPFTLINEITEANQEILVQRTNSHQTGIIPCPSM